eukprot:CAMPEP_0184732188 /NCGR_PEP_ID=MMETSP0314-20130426/53351_1 /TAXON_ID=38298 /ORGANISM="Rhodella maculata, Strain CCMP 736" /LENGTH=198 /DNA_ID=CAMNT_0027198715 /DNA_START=176 /DNA_END=772 /DNA_ORIENTATION=+
MDVEVSIGNLLRLATGARFRQDGVRAVVIRPALITASALPPARRSSPNSQLFREHAEAHRRRHLLRQHPRRLALAHHHNLVRVLVGNHRDEAAGATATSPGPDGRQHHKVAGRVPKRRGDHDRRIRLLLEEPRTSKRDGRERAGGAEDAVGDDNVRGVGGDSDRADRGLLVGTPREAVAPRQVRSRATYAIRLDEGLV